MNEFNVGDYVIVRSSKDMWPHEDKEGWPSFATMIIQIVAMEDDDQLYVINHNDYNYYVQYNVMAQNLWSADRFSGPITEKEYNDLREVKNAPLWPDKKQREDEFYLGDLDLDDEQ